MRNNGNNIHGNGRQYRDDYSYDQERQMHYILDEGISELKKSSDTNKSGLSQNQSSERSFTLRNQMQGDQESRSNSREVFKRHPHNSHPERYPSKQQMNNSNIQNHNQQQQQYQLAKNDSSSLRMFLEELKNEENSSNHLTHSRHPNTNTQNPQKALNNNHNYDNDIPRQINTQSNKQYQQQHLQFSPNQLSSLASSANIEMLRIQEESFSKIHNDIASLQNKIKGLETKLGTKPQNTNSSTRPPAQTYQIQPNQPKVFQEKQDFSNRQNLTQQSTRGLQDFDENENRIRKYKQSSHNSQQKYNSNRQHHSNHQHQQEQSNNSYNQGIGKENTNTTQIIDQQNEVLSSSQSEQEQDNSSTSDTHSYQTFPLRLKKQFVQQQQDIENQRVQLNERYNQPRQIITTDPSSQTQNIVSERYEAINDSSERRPVKRIFNNKHNGQKLQYQDQVRSLTETDQYTENDDYLDQRYNQDQDESQYDDEDQDLPSKNDIDPDESGGAGLNDSTISVSEKMKQRIKRKMQQYKEKSRGRRGSERRSSSKKELSHNKILSASLKRSNTQDFTKQEKENGSRVRRQVRFSETKRSSKSRRNSTAHHESVQQQKSSSTSHINNHQHQLENNSSNNMLDLKRQNSSLRQELDQLRKKYEVRDEYYNKYRDLKVKYKSLQGDYKALDLKRKEQKEVIDEQKLIIAKLKKMLKTQKEKVKKLKGETPDGKNENTNNKHIITKSVSKSYKSFKTNDDGHNSSAATTSMNQHQRQKSQKKLQPSDINTIRNKSKSIKLKRI